jgi:hypothetical protein
VFLLRSTQSLLSCQTVHIGKAVAIQVAQVAWIHLSCSIPIAGGLISIKSRMFRLVVTTSAPLHLQSIHRTSPFTLSLESLCSACYRLQSLHLLILEFLKLICVSHTSLELPGASAAFPMLPGAFPECPVASMAFLGLLGAFATCPMLRGAFWERPIASMAFLGLLEASAASLVLPKASLERPVASIAFLGLPGAFAACPLLFGAFQERPKPSAAFSGLSGTLAVFPVLPGASTPLLELPDASGAFAELPGASECLRTSNVVSARGENNGGHCH